MTDVTGSNAQGMTATVKAVVAVLVVAVVVALGFLFRSSGRAADLEARVANLESQRENLRTSLSAAEKDATDLRARLAPFENKQAAAMRINQELVIAPGTTQTYVFTPTVVPGTLSGTWRSSGRGYGGADDTINAFRLSDPKDAVLESSPAGPLSNGRFLVKVNERGAYTFFFDNKGILRNTPRRVFLEAEFKPD
jgi:hypothetical protein